ncbi:MAG: peptide deformylase [Clostridiales bacterium]|nr:peptide deformylase [Clostridiales bacterium]
MALRNILLENDPILRKKSREVTKFDEKLWILLDDMYETMIHSDGVGLAAPQVGILRRAIVVDFGDDKYELVNPEIISQKGKQCELEGCLSIPGENGYVERPTFVKIKAQNRYGKDITVIGRDRLAVCFCHEIDHLNGVLYVDKLAEPPKGAHIDEYTRLPQGYTSDKGKKVSV